jgi:hypothetical protein
MSLFGSSPPDEAPTTAASAFGRSTSSLFEDEPAMTKSTSSALFQDDDPSGASSPWDMPTPRKAKSRADLLKTLLPASDVPESYIEIFDAVVRGSGNAGKITAGGVARTLAAAHISADEQARIMAIVAPSGGTGSGEVALGRNEFNALLALIGLAQDGEVPNLDGVDERRRSQFPSAFLFPIPRSMGSYLIGHGCFIDEARARLVAAISVYGLSQVDRREPQLQWVTSSPTTWANKVVNLQICHSRSFQGLSTRISLSSLILASSVLSPHSGQLPRREPRASRLLLQAKLERYRRR